MSETEVAYKKAFIKFVNRYLPQLMKHEVAYKTAYIKYVNVDLPRIMKQRDAETSAMNALAHAIRLMPTSLRMRY